MKEYFGKIILLYIQEKKKALKLSTEHPALLMFDNFNARCVLPLLLNLLDSHNFNVALIPLNCTDRLQPLDLSVNKTGKDFYVISLENGMQSMCAHKLKKVKARFGI